MALRDYRAIAVKADGHVNLFSRRRKSFDHHYPLIVEALAELPEGTVVDGEVVALDDSGRPDFNLLQNFRSESQHIHYFIFDLLVCQEHDLPLTKRRQLLKSHLEINSGRIRIAEQFEAKANDILAAVRQQKLEGVIGKRKDSLYWTSRKRQKDLYPALLPSASGELPPYDKGLSRKSSWPDRATLTS